MMFESSYLLVTNPLSLQIHILGFLQQGRFHHFKPVMDLYVRRHFSAALAYTSLMATLNEQVKGWQDETTGDRLKGVFEVRWRGCEVRRREVVWGVCAIVKWRE